jgi:gentisate 1,2-dioxygenase
VVWLDGLDIPLVRSLEAAWASKMRPASVPTTASDPSEDEFTAAGLVPRRSRYPATGFPQVRWPWRTVRAALARLAASAAAEAPVTLRYVDPTTGAPPLPTMGAEAQWLRPGERTRADRTTVSRVYHVIEGHGLSRVGETPRKVETERGDYRGFYANVHDAIQNKAPLDVTPEQALRTMRAVLLAHKSSREGRAVQWTEAVE